jgi:hypothetical protein
MRMTFNVTYEDGRVVEAVAKPKDIVAFERQYGVSMGAIGEDARMEWLFYLAWSPLHRSKQEPAAFDAFLDVVAGIDPVADEVEPAPFPPAPSDGPSPD